MHTHIKYKKPYNTRRSNGTKRAHGSYSLKNSLEPRILFDATAIVGADVLLSSDVAVSPVDGSATTVNGDATTINADLTVINADTTIGVAADQTVTIGVIASDVSLTLTADSISIIGEPSNGSATINPETNLIGYTPNVGYSGIDTITYTTTDANGIVSEPITVTVEVLPVGTSDNYIVDAGSPLALNGLEGVLVNDVGTGISIVETSVTTANGGQVNFNVDGSFTYVPLAGTSGIDSFEYTLVDADGLVSAPIRGTINVLPVGAVDNYTTDVASTLMIDQSQGVLANDIGTALSIVETSVTTTKGGQVNFNPDGSLTYIPLEGSSGIDTFEYTMFDLDGLVSAPIRGTISVLPVGTLDNYITDAGSPLTLNELQGVLANDVGTGISIVETSVTTANGGQVNFNVDGSFTYVPLAGTSGIDSFEYTVVDADGLVSAPIRGTINVLPVGAVDSYAVDAESPLSLDASRNLLLNDIGTSLSVVEGAVASVNGGSVVLQADGSFTYAPPNGFSGIDTFQYMLKDADGQLISVEASVNVHPVAVDDAGYTVMADGAVNLNLIGNDVGINLDIDSIIVEPQHGSLVLNPDKTVTYLPNLGYVGSDTFSYVLKGDGGSAVLPATVTISVEAVPIVANQDNYQTVAQKGNNGIGLSIDAINGLLANDQGTGLLSVTPQVALETEKGGVVNIHSDGSFEYTPRSNFSGTDRFAYNITDSLGQTAANVATIKVIPSVNNDAFTVKAGHILHGGNLLANDIGSRLRIVDFSTVGTFHGILKVNANGTFTYDPYKNFIGTDTFTYTAMDINGNLVTGTVSLTVDATKRGNSSDSDFDKSASDLLTSFGCR